jgi:OOP family OmpA-OmpF porin
MQQGRPDGRVAVQGRTIEGVFSMSNISRNPAAPLVLGLLFLAAPTGLTAQEPMPPEAEPATIVYGEPPADLSGLTEGARVDGFVSARNGNRMQVTSADGARTIIAISETTQIRGSGGFLGLGRDKLDSASLLNGLPVSVETRQWGDALVASRIELKSKDLRTAAMIRNGTDQRFAEQTAATEALRGRMGDIDKYNIKGTTNVNFAVGQSTLSPQAKSELCAAAAQADAMDNALMLVVGYTDSTGSEELNQQLSEKRASRVVNYLQQTCGWKPYRMLTPTGMAEADPLADNSTAYGKSQNRRVAVNILVSKSVDGL